MSTPTCNICFKYIYNLTKSNSSFLLLLLIFLLSFFLGLTIFANRKCLKATIFLLRLCFPCYCLVARSLVLWFLGYYLLLSFVEVLPDSAVHCTSFPTVSLLILHHDTSLLPPWEHPSAEGAVYRSWTGLYSIGLNHGVPQPLAIFPDPRWSV